LENFEEMDDEIYHLNKKIKEKGLPCRERWDNARSKVKAREKGLSKTREPTSLKR